MEKFYFFICSNNTCKNTRILFGNEISFCYFCGKKMSSFEFDNIIQEERDLAEKELAQCSAKLIWLDDSQIEQWPGPIAFEYVRLQDIMLAGNIEGACWKIANLAEVIAAYYYSAAIERGLEGCFNNILFIGKKISIAEKSFNGSLFYDLIKALKTVIEWRNSFGVGHGSLSRNKELYIEKLIELCERLNLTLNGLKDTLELNGLCFKDEADTQIIGHNYIYKITPESWGRKITCTLDKSADNVLTPTIQGYQFSGPDVYFFDQTKSGIRKYKNFRQNKIKYLEVIKTVSEQIVWIKDPWQVAWLNPNEQELWFKYYRDKASYAAYSEVNREVLVDAITQFQKRGMHDQANQCHQLYEECNSQVGETELLRFKKLLSKYIQAASLGKRKSANEKLKKLDKLQERIIDEDQKRKLFITTSIDVSWYEGVFGELDHALDICEKGLKEVRLIKSDYPLSATLQELELMKNKIYLCSRRNNIQDYNEFIKKCKELLYVASRIYNYNPENDRIIDILGFACNLYGDFYMGMLGENGQESEIDCHNIYELNQFGLKIRERMFMLFPDDIWAIRGYAWSLHNNGKLEFRFKNNRDKAIECLVEAEKIRLNGEYKYRDDLGLKEDLFENYIQYINYGLPQEERIKEAEDRLDFIQEREGNSLRVIRLREKLKKAQD